MEGEQPEMVVNDVHGTSPPQEPSHVEAHSPPRKTSSVKPKAKSAVDRVELSEGAKALAEKSALQGASEEAKVESARQRLASGE